MADHYRVKLDLFEGPLDLLLHLVKKNEVEIGDVPTAAITEQYLDYIEVMHQLRLDVAGEYLVMAATLLLIKSRTLLPPSEDEEEEEDDPRAHLVRQLQDYQRFREAALALSERPLLNRDVFAREPLNAIVADAPEVRSPDEPLRLEVTVWQLIEAMRGVLDRARKESVHEVAMERVSLRDRTRILLDHLRRARTLEFDSIFTEDSTRVEIIVTFLALLEIMKMGVATAVQRERMGPILIELTVDDVSNVSLESLDEYETSTTVPGDEDGAIG